MVVISCKSLQTKLFGQDIIYIQLPMDLICKIIHMETLKSARNSFNPPPRYLRLAD